MTSGVTIREVLVPALEAAFPESGMRSASPPGPVAVFPAACAEVGEVQVYDDGDEATIVIEWVTHYHTNPYDPEMVANERTRWVNDEVVEFLRALFADRILLWSRQQGKAGGGWAHPYLGVIPDGVPDDADVFLWSRRLERTG
jgi:hypothetical protein